MEFTIRISNPKRAKKFAKYLSAFKAIDHCSLKEENESEKPLLDQIATLIEPKPKAKKTQRKVNMVAVQQIHIQSVVTSMSDLEKEEARMEHENIKRMFSFRAKVSKALRAHYEKTKDQDPPSDQLVISIKELFS